jgi:uncharacterized protein
MLYNLHLRDNMDVSKEIRSALLEDHLSYIDDNRDIIVLGGALLDEDGQTRIGSAFILNVANRGDADRFSINEPFRKAGLYASVTITRMRRAQWAPEHAPASPDA